MDLLNLRGRRGSKRHEVDYAACVITSWQQESDARVTNISRLGLRLEGPRKLVDTVFPNFNPPRGQPRPGLRVRIDIAGDISLPRGIVEIGAQTVYVRRVEQDWFQIGLEFTEIGSDAAPLLEALVRGLEQADP